ncbi:hypothetical protein ABIB48_003018 [Arthrobacter sp. UYCu511]
MARNRKTAEQVVELIRSSGGLPSMEEVSSQGFWFYPRHWLSKWDKVLMPQIPKILGNEGRDNRGRKWLTRQDLFNMGQSIDTVDDAIEFYVAVCSWGVGNKARDVYRRIPPLMHPEVGERLLLGIKILQGMDGSAIAGYKAFSSPDIAYLKGLGPAFFSKLLYFADGVYSSGRDKQALILDQKVAKSIGWPAKTWWRADEYQDYLELVDQACKLLDPCPRADGIEYALFRG